MQTDLVLGLDIGGTSTRALVSDLDGNRLGSGKSSGANITSNPPDKALAAIRSAVTDALSTVDASAVRAAVIGVAGTRNLAEPAVESELKQIWHDVGLTCGYQVTNDGAVAFAAGTAKARGTLILAGTGALICRVAGGRIEQFVDGHGWLLGDLGSGFSIGREAVRATLMALDSGTPLRPLGRAVLEQVLGDANAELGRATVHELILKVHARPPVALAELAPVVTAHVLDDPEAARIIREAADHLISSAQVIRMPESVDPVVLAGGLLVGDTPLAAAVRERVTALWQEADISVAHDGAAGAAWLAARQIATMTAEARDHLFEGR